jgi:hypothetical protein
VKLTELSAERSVEELSTLARDEAVAEEREATEDQQTAHSSTAEVGESGALRWLHDRVRLLRSTGPGRRIGKTGGAGKRQRRQRRQR